MYEFLRGWAGQLIESLYIAHGKLITQRILHQIYRPVFLKVLQDVLVGEDLLCERVYHLPRYLHLPWRESRGRSTRTPLAAAHQLRELLGGGPQRGYGAVLFLVQPLTQRLPLPLIGFGVEFIQQAVDRSVHEHVHGDQVDEPLPRRVSDSPGGAERLEVHVERLPRWVHA